MEEQVRGTVGSGKGVYVDNIGSSSKVEPPSTLNMVMEANQKSYAAIQSLKQDVSDLVGFVRGYLVPGDIGVPEKDVDGWNLIGGENIMPVMDRLIAQANDSTGTINDIHADISRLRMIIMG